MTIRVLVADDQSMVRAGFRMLLGGEEDIEVVAEASNGLEAVDKAARFDPTVVLMDIRMPELDGLAATRRILAADSGARILVLTTFDLDEYVYEALTAGASGFVLKDDPPEQLLAAIRIVAGGEALLSPAITKRVIEKFTRISHREPPSELAELTERELDVFRLIARGLSNAEIGQELYISDATVKTHVTHILQKLDLRDRVQAVVLAHETRLFEDDPRRPSSRAGEGGTLSGRRGIEALVFGSATAVVLVHALDDAVLNRQPGVDLGQHALALVLALVIGIGAIATFPLLRPGVARRGLPRLRDPGARQRWAARRPHRDRRSRSQRLHGRSGCRRRCRSRRAGTCDPFPTPGRAEQRRDPAGGRIASSRSWPAPSRSTSSCSRSVALSCRPTSTVKRSASHQALHTSPSRSTPRTAYDSPGGTLRRRTRPL